MTGFPQGAVVAPAHVRVGALMLRIATAQTWPPPRPRRGRRGRAGPGRSSIRGEREHVPDRPSKPMSNRQANEAKRKSRRGSRSCSIRPLDGAAAVAAILAGSQSQSTRKEGKEEEEAGRFMPAVMSATKREHDHGGETAAERLFAGNRASRRQARATISQATAETPRRAASAATGRSLPRRCPGRSAGPRRWAGGPRTNSAKTSPTESETQSRLR